MPNAAKSTEHVPGQKVRFTDKFGIHQVGTFLHYEMLPALGGEKRMAIVEGDFFQTGRLETAAVTPGKLEPVEPSDIDARGSMPNQNFWESMENHGIKTQGISWFSMVVTLEKSKNDYLKYPVKGVLRVCEQGVSLGVSRAIFHVLKDDGTLGAPVSADKPVFRYEGGI